MPYSGPEPLDNPTTTESDGEIVADSPSVTEVLQVGGSRSAPDDIANLVSPLLLSLSDVLDGVPVAIALPATLVSEPFGHAETPPVLCALAPSDHYLGDTLARIALEARERSTGVGDDLERRTRQDTVVQVESSERHVFVCPVPFDGNDAGILVALGAGMSPLPERQVSLATGFAKSIGAGLRVISSHLRRVRASSALVEVARTAGSTLQLEEVLDLVTERTDTLVGADRCGLWLLEKDDVTLRPSSLYGMPEDFVRQWKQNAIPLESEPISKEAIRSQHPVLVPDAPNDPRTDKDAVSFFGDKTILVLPLIARGQVQGTLFINHVRFPHHYTGSELETATAIANQAAIAIQNARLYTEVEQWSSQLERLQSIMSKLSRSRSVSSIAGIIADELRNLIKYDNCRVLVLQEDTNELVPLAVVSSSHEYPVATLESLRIAMGQGITGYVAETGVPLLVGDAARDSRAYYIPGTEVVDESMVAVPINFEGRVIGVITLSRLGLYQFTKSDMRLLQIFVSEAAIEFENARLYQETQKKSRELLASFHRVGDALATGLDVDDTLQIITELAAEMVRAKGCAILLVDDSSGGLVFRSAKGLPIDLTPGYGTPAGRGMAWQVVRDGVPKLVPDLSAVEQPDWMSHPGAVDLRSYLGVPLMLGGRTIGVLAVFGNRTDQFNQTDVELLSSFAHQGAISIRNARLFSSLQERVRELAGLAEISHSIATLTNLDDTYRELSRSIAQLLHAESCALLLTGRDEILVPQFPAHGFSPEELSGLKFRVDNSEEEVEECCCPIQSVDGLVVTCTGQWKGRPWLVAPMRAQDRLIGAVLVSGRMVSAYNENDIRLLTILSANAAVIVQNAILFQNVESERDELEAIISNTSDAIIILDQDDRVARCNAAAESLTGWHSSEVVGRPCEELLLGQMPVAERSTKAGSTLLEVIEKRHMVPYFEGIVVTKEGTERDVAASYSYVRTTGRGEGMGVIIARDISKLREVERMKSEFVSMVSHELRTPLGLIKGYASTLLNPQLSIDEATTHRFLLGVDGAADRLAKLIENILSVSRIESGLFRLTTQEMDLSQVIDNAVTTARATAKGHEITMDLPRNPITVEGDRVQIELVMDNLLGNAVKYSPMGRPIRVELHERGSDVEVTVMDEGIGIAAHHLPKVFDKFYRVEGGYSRRTPGSGLGLYICRNIIEAHRGRIWAESTPGQGSTFAFALPVSQSRQHEPTDIDASAQALKGG
jgi:PAS domain S-box-containing protein